MATIPQLRKDIMDLQERLRAAQAEIARLKAIPPKEIVRVVEKPVQVVKTVEVEVPGPERIIYTQGPERIVYRDNPAHVAMIKKLQGKA